MNTTYLLPEKTKMTLGQVVKKYQCLAPEYSLQKPQGAKSERNATCSESTLCEVRNEFQRLGPPNLRARACGP